MRGPQSPSIAVGGPVAEAPARAILTATGLWRLRRVLGLRRTVRVPGARYTERTAEPLHRALSRHGQGVKEYDAEFADGSRLRLRATRQRVYADLARPPRLDAFEAADGLVRPGVRALALEGGTGWAGERLSRLVGPSGAVVSLDRDEESVRFAQRRYRLRNTAYEVGHVESLKGETDGSFDAAVAIEAFAPGEEVPPALAELWRLIPPMGALVVGARRDAEGAAPDTPRLSHADLERALRDTTGEGSEVRDLGKEGDPWWIAAAIRPEAQ